MNLPGIVVASESRRRPISDWNPETVAGFLKRGSTDLGIPRPGDLPYWGSVSSASTRWLKSVSHASGKPLSGKSVTGETVAG